MTAPTSNRLDRFAPLLFAPTGITRVIGVGDSRMTDGSSGGSNFMRGFQRAANIPVVGRGGCPIPSVPAWSMYPGQIQQSTPAATLISTRNPGSAYRDTDAGVHCTPTLDFGIPVGSDMGAGLDIYSVTMADAPNYFRGDWTAGVDCRMSMVYRGDAGNFIGRIATGRNTRVDFYPASYTQNAIAALNMSTPTGIQVASGLCGTGSGWPTLSVKDVVAGSHVTLSGKNCQILHVRARVEAATVGVELDAIATASTKTTDIADFLGSGAGGSFAVSAANVNSFLTAIGIDSTVRTMFIVDAGTNQTAAETTDYTGGGYSVYKANMAAICDTIDARCVAVTGRIADCILLQTPYVAVDNSFTGVANGLLQNSALYELSRSRPNVCYYGGAGVVRATLYSTANAQSGELDAYRAIPTEDNTHPTGSLSAHPGTGDMLWALRLANALEQAYVGNAATFRLNRLVRT